MRRRTAKPVDEGNKTGDITHLEARRSISLFVRYVKNYLRFIFATGKLPLEDL
jgi:hypothetical protein